MGIFEVSSKLRPRAFDSWNNYLLENLSRPWLWWY